MDLGKKVKQRRKELGMSQEDLALKMGYKSRTSINKIEMGRPVSQKIILKLADALGVTAPYLMGWDENEIIQQAAFDAVVTKAVAKDEDLRSTLKMYMALPEDKKRTVRQMIEDYFNAFANG